MQNQVMDVVTTRDGDPDQKVPIVDQSAIYRPQKFLRGLNGFNASMQFGAGRQIGDQKIRVLNERPFLLEIETTQDVNPGDVVMNVSDASFVRRNERIAQKAVQDLRCNADPTSVNQIPIDAAQAFIPAGSTLLLHGPTVGEGWQRSKPLSRATENHDDFTSTKQRSVAITWHARFREHYVEKEQFRISQQSKEEFNRILGYELMLGEAFDGTNSGEFSTNGLINQGLDYNYTYVSGGVLTQEMIDEAGFALMSEGNAAGNLDLVSGQKLVSKMSRAAINAGIVRHNSPMDPTLGVDMINRSASATDNITGYNIRVDHTLNSKQWNRIVLLINWDAIYAIQNGDDLLQGSLDDANNNAADPGSGVFLMQMTRSVGFAYRIPTGAVYMFDNVGTVRY